MSIKKIVFLLKLRMYKLLKKDDMEVRVSYYRSQGMEIGNRVRIFSDLAIAEPYLITIGDDVTISEGVRFLTHDNSVIKLPCSEGTDLVGRICIGNNCFIGCNTVFLPGVRIADNIIVGAGSIVTKSCLESHSIYAGNPAKKIGTWDSYLKKSKTYMFNFSPDGIRMNLTQRKKIILENEEKLIRK